MNVIITTIVFKKRAVMFRNRAPPLWSKISIRIIMNLIKQKCRPAGLKENRCPRKILDKILLVLSPYKYKKIKQLVNHEVMKLGLEPLSLSSIKMFLAQPEIDIINWFSKLSGFKSSVGRAAAEIPSSKRRAPQYFLTQMEEA